MNEYRKKLLLDILSFFGFAPLLSWYFYRPSPVSLSFLLVIGLTVITLNLIWYWTDIKTLTIGLLFALISAILVIIVLSFFTNTNIGHIDILMNLDPKYKVIIILIVWPIISQTIFKKIGNVDALRALLKSNIDRINDWSALSTSNEQGTDIKEIELGGELLKQLTFSVESGSKYWRAGFKIVEPNGMAIPLRSSAYHYILFHVGSNNGEEVGLYIYDALKELDSGPTKALVLPNITTNNLITISVLINENNFLQCLVNNKVEYEKHIDSGIRKKVYLLAWGDGNDYEVDFKNISYQK